MTRNKSSRRRVVLGTAAGALTSLAGCMNTDSTSGAEPTDAMEGDGAMADESPGEAMEDDQMTHDGAMEPTDPDSAERASIDRFSQDAGTLFVRENNDALPGPDEPIDFDQAFLTKGLGPDGEPVEYYNFDVQPTGPAPIFAFFHENGDPVADQLNVVDVIPGDPGYNDFWLVNKVTVPDDYEANTITSVDALHETDYAIEATQIVKNCPIVPEGSTAGKHFGDDHDEAPLVQGWYDGKLVEYFLFEEDTFETSDGAMPVSPIYVSFNTNPGEDGGGPASGFRTEAESDQTHNVLATVPGDDGYSPLWLVNVYDNADFPSVSDLASAKDAAILASGTATVNCPVVSVGGSHQDGAMAEESAMEEDGAMEQDTETEEHGAMKDDGAMEG